MNALLLALALTAALQDGPPPADSPLARGAALTRAFYAGELETVWARLSARMHEVFGDADGLAAFRTQVRDQLGTEQSVIEEQVQASSGLHIYVRTARFDKAPVPIQVQWALDPDGRVQGFMIRPVPREAPSDFLDYETQATLHLPFTGRWSVFWGGRTLAQNAHASTIDQRFAYDLVMEEQGSTHTGDGAHNEDYFCFDRPILAPAAGTVVEAGDGIADNVPGEMNPRQPLGNHVILDLGHGEYAFLCHFRQGTVAVEEGDQVQTGALLGRCGNSGNSSEPHLHLHLQDTPVFGQGHGLPAPFVDYLADGEPVARGEPVKGQHIAPAPDD